jgi:hypothetical protein
MWKNIYTWLDERLGFDDMYKMLLDRPEPHGNWWNTLGSASLFLFIMQGMTGIFLTVYYTPSPDHAYDSIQYIMNGVAFGWLIRGAENPELLLRQYMDDMRAQIPRLNAQVAEVIKHEKLVEMNYERTQQRVAELQPQVEAAVKMGPEKKEAAKSLIVALQSAQQEYCRAAYE